MAAAVVSVFPGVRLLTIGDANGEIQRHQEQQALRLEARTGPDAACLALYSLGSDLGLYVDIIEHQMATLSVHPIVGRLQYWCLLQTGILD